MASKVYKRKEKRRERSENGVLFDYTSTQRGKTWIAAEEFQRAFGAFNLLPLYPWWKRSHISSYSVCCSL